MVSAYKCPLTCFGGSAFASASIFGSERLLFLKKTRPHYPQIPSRQPQAPTYSAHSHAVSEISVSHHQHRLFEVLPYVCVRVCVCVCELQPWRWHKFSRETPSVPKLSRKRKSPPLTPSTAHSLFPLSGTHWGTVLVSAPVTQHFPHSTVSLPIAFASPHFAGSFHLHEGNEPLPLKHKKKKKERYFPPPCTWCITDLLCLHLKQSMIQVFRFNMETRLFLISLTPPRLTVWNLFAAYTKGWSVGDEQLLLPLTLIQGDVFRVKKKKTKKKKQHKKKKLWSSCTWQAAQAGRQPHPAASPLINLSPLSSIPLPLVPVRGLCTSVRKSSFHNLEQQDAT